MTTKMLLPWFPIVLAVGVGGHLLNRSRATLFAGCCALFWVALTQAAYGSLIWTEASVLFALATGSVAIIAIGVWAGRDVVSPAITEATPNSDARERLADDPHASGLDAVAQQVCLFEEWLAEHGGRYNPWPAFGEFIRMSLHAVCGASHVRAYRLDEPGEELVALREVEPMLATERRSARRGVVGYVVTSGTAYIEGDPMQGSLVDELATRDDRECAWCFPVNRGTHRAGVVIVGRLDASLRPPRAALWCMEHLIGQFWRTLDATSRCLAAERTDPVSGLAMRPAFLNDAERVTSESHQQGEPVAVALFSIEGLRALADAGSWDAAESLAAEVAHTLRGKLRTDDRIGRFDGSRFIVLLRRVDSELAMLIVEQLMARLEEVCHDKSRWGAAIRVRCGLVGSGTERTDVVTLTRRVLQQDQRAREGQMRMATDLGRDFVREAAAATS